MPAIPDNTERATSALGIADLAKKQNAILEILRMIKEPTTTGLSWVLSDNNFIVKVEDSGSGGGSGAGFSPFAATSTEDGSYISAIGSGLILLPLTFAPAISVSGESAGSSDTHAWVHVEWSTSTYALTSAVITYGTAWPATYYGTGFVNIPIAYISSGVLVRITTTNITLHMVFTTAGVVLAPAST